MTFRERMIDFDNKIKTGDISLIREVISYLENMKNEKTFGELKMLEKAKDLVKDIK